MRFTTLHFGVVLEMVGLNSREREYEKIVVARIVEKNYWLQATIGTETNWVVCSTEMNLKRNRSFTMIELWYKKTHKRT